MRLRSHPTNHTHTCVHSQLYRGKEWVKVKFLSARNIYQQCKFMAKFGAKNLLQQAEEMVESY